MYKYVHTFMYVCVCLYVCKASSNEWWVTRENGLIKKGQKQD